MMDIRLEPLQLSQIGVVNGVQVYPMGQDPYNPVNQYRIQQNWRQNDFSNTNRFNSFNNNTTTLREEPIIPKIEPVTNFSNNYNNNTGLIDNPVVELVKTPEFKPRMSAFDKLYTRYNMNINPFNIPPKNDLII